MLHPFSNLEFKDMDQINLRVKKKNFLKEMGLKVNSETTFTGCTNQNRLAVALSVS